MTIIEKSDHQRLVFALTMFTPDLQNIDNPFIYRERRQIRDDALMRSLHRVLITGPALSELIALSKTDRTAPQPRSLFHQPRIVVQRVSQLTTSVIMVLFCYASFVPHSSLLHEKTYMPQHFAVG